MLTLKKQSRPAEYTDDKNEYVPLSKISNDNDNNTTEAIAVQNEIDSTKSTCSLVSFNGYGGNHFVARMLLNIESKKYYSKKRTGTIRGLMNAPVVFKEDKLYSKVDFTLFSCLSEVSMINEKFSNGNLSFRLTIGNCGYENSNTDNSSNFTKKMKPLKLSKDMPVYLPFEKRKHCLSVQFNTYDTSHILYKMNYIRKKTDELVNGKKIL